MFKKIFPKLFVGFWMLLLLACGGYYLFFAPRESVYSSTENRTLAGFPEVTFDSVFSGKFGEDFETYLLDKFPLRNGTITAVNRLESLLSLATHDDYLLITEGMDDPLVDNDVSVDINDLLDDFNQSRPSHEQSEASDIPAWNPEASDDISADTSSEVSEEQGEYPPINPKPPAKLEDYPETMGMYMDIGNGPLPILSYNRNYVAAVTAVLNKYADALPEDGKLMFTVVPQSPYSNRFVNAAVKNSFYCDWDDAVYGLSRDNVYVYDTPEILSEHIKNGEYIYYRTDSHWTVYGAYQLYEKMVIQAGKTPTPISDFELIVEEPFRGTCYRDNPSAYMNVTPDVLNILKPGFDVELRRITSGEEYKVIDFFDFNARANDRYCVFLGGPAGPWTYAKSDNGETENCLVVTDSFGLSMIPFLTTNYNEVHYYDARYFNQQVCGGSVSELMERYNIQDIYFIVGDIHSFGSGFILSNVNNHFGK